MTDQWDQFPDAPTQQGRSDPWSAFPDAKPSPTAQPQASKEEPSTWADVAKTIPSGLARGVSGALGLPGEIGHGMRYLTDQARQAMGYPASPEYVAGTGKFAQALSLSPEQQDVQKRIEQATGPLYEPQTTVGRYANAAAEIAGGSAIPFGGASRPGALSPYLRNWLVSSTAAGGASEAAKDIGAPPAVQAAAGLAGGVAAPRALNAALAERQLDSATVEKLKAARAAETENIDVPKAAVAGNILKPAAGRIASLPIVGEPLQTSAKSSLEQTANRAQEIANLYGAGNRAGTGEHLRDAIIQYIDTGSYKPINRLYDQVDNLVDNSVINPLTHTSMLRSSLQNAETAAQRRTNQSVINLIDEDLSDPRGGLTYSGIKELRTKIGSMIDDNLLPEAGTVKPVLKRVYGSLTKDLRNSVLASGDPPALEAFDKANRLNEMMSRRREELRRIVGKAGGNAGENVFETMIQMASDTGKSANIERLKLARKAIGEWIPKKDTALLPQPMGSQTWDDFSSAFIRRMGENPKTGDFSPDRFLTAYGKLSPEGAQLLFNSTGRGDLAASIDRLARVSRQFSDFYKMGNPSGTAGATFVTSLFGLGSIGGLLNPLATLGAASSAGGMWGFAKYMASPANVDKMTRTLQARFNYQRTPNPGTEQQLANAASSLMESLKPYMQQAPDHEQRLNEIEASPLSPEQKRDMRRKIIEDALRNP